MTIRQLKPVRSDNGQSGQGLEPEPLAPHSIEAEEAVIGSVLLNPNIIHDLKGWLQSHHFFIVKHQWIYEAMLSLVHRREHIDILTLAAELEARNQITEIGGNIRGDAYLMRLANDTPTSIHATTYAKVVKEFSRRRDLVDIAVKLAKASTTFSADGSESSEAKRLLEDAKQLLDDPYDPVTDGLRQHLIHAKDLDMLPEISWLVPGEIPDKSLTIVFGPSGVGKSFFVLDYALRIAQALPVLYVAAEGEGGFKKRVQAWKLHFHQGVGNLQFYLNVAALLNDQERRAFVSQIIDYVKPKLIILDTVAHCMLPGDENSARDMGLFLRAAKEIQKTYDCAVLLVHHTNKEGAIERGSGSLRGAADSMIRLVADDDIISVECSKSKDAEPFKTRYLKLLPVQISETDYAPVLIASEKIQQQKTDPLTNNQRLVIETITDVFEMGAPFSDLVDVTKLNRGAVQRILSKMRKLGFLKQEDRGAPYFVTPDGLNAIGRLAPTESVSPVSIPVSVQDSHEDPHQQTEDSQYRQDSVDLTEYLTNFEGESDRYSESSRTGTGEISIDTPRYGASLDSPPPDTADTTDTEIPEYWCDMCEKRLEHTPKGWKCPDCGAIWHH
jgi:KaiC/GvpD/RAD55 family RecA-like ATPase/DNA-binding MarR family transcriptional regulator